MHKLREIKTELEFIRKNFGHHCPKSKHKLDEEIEIYSE